jgi:two-component system sensor histidine kinase AlgZ
MTPITSSARRLLAYVVLWLIAGVALAGVFLNAALTPSWFAALGFAVPMAVSLGFVGASAYYVCRSVVLTQRSGWQTAVVFGSASVLSGGLWVLLCWTWNALGANLLPDGAMVNLPGNVLGTLLLLGSALYLISLLIHDIWLAADQLRAAQAREAQSRLQARDAQLQVLRTQINPHFLFNSLNSISALTSQNAAAARAMTLELAAFFRQTLALAEKDRIALAQEIALCDHFLAVEKIRFGDRLQTRMEVSDAAAPVLIPPMLLQPCLENAVKHGVRHLPEGGCITLRAFVQGPWLYLSIDNPIDPDARPEAGTGTGLANIQQRLVTLYGARARMLWTQQATSFTLEIVLPVE